jgi:hypothetical protein
VETGDNVRRDRTDNLFIPDWGYPPDLLCDQPARRIVEKRAAAVSSLIRWDRPAIVADRIVSACGSVKPFCRG